MGWQHAGLFVQPRPESGEWEELPTLFHAYTCQDPSNNRLDWPISNQCEPRDPCL